MILPDDIKKLTKLALDTAEECNITRGSRQAAYRQYGQWIETGRQAGGLALGNMLMLGLAFFLIKIFALAAAVVLVETVNAKLRLFRVPDLLSAAFVLAAMALLSTFLFH